MRQAGVGDAGAGELQDLHVGQALQIGQAGVGNVAVAGELNDLELAQASERRRRSHKQQKKGRNLRAAVEATMRSIKQPFPAGKLPVRGKFRMASMVIGSAAVSNVRRIQRYLQAKPKAKTTQPVTPDAEKRTREQAVGSFWAFLCTSLTALCGFARLKMLAVSC